MKKVFKEESCALCSMHTTTAWHWTELEMCRNHSFRIFNVLGSDWKDRGRRARKHQTPKYLDSLCAPWKGNVSPTQLTRAWSPMSSMTAQHHYKSSRWKTSTTHEKRNAITKTENTFSGIKNTRQMPVQSPPWSATFSWWWGLCTDDPVDF